MHLLFCLNPFDILNSGINPNIIFGVQENPELNDQMLISIVATEFDNDFDPFAEAPVAPQTIVNSNSNNEEDEEEEESILPSFLNN